MSQQILCKLLFDKLRPYVFLTICPSLLYIKNYIQFLHLSAVLSDISCANRPISHLWFFHTWYEMYGIINPSNLSYAYHKIIRHPLSIVRAHYLGTPLPTIFSSTRFQFPHNLMFIVQQLYHFHSEKL